MNRVRMIIHADEAYKKGIWGAGVGVAVLDTGIYRHSDFEKRITGFKDIVKGMAQCYDDCSHGTHVSGILGGNGAASGGRFMGVAPKCNIVHVKVLDRKGNGSREDVLEGIDWVIENKDRYGIRIMNISVGTVKESDKNNQLLVDAVEKAWDAGLVVVVAAGNMGPGPMSITVPGNSRKVITAGAFDDCMKQPKDPAVRPCYSGRGPTQECICKPDIVAPGSGIISCNAVSYRNRRLYCVKSGTSMATPVVSGCIALLLSNEPGLSNVEVKMRLHETARDLGYPNNQQGWGMIDVKSFLKL